MNDRSRAIKHVGVVFAGSLLAGTLMVCPSATAAVKSIQVGKTHVTVEVEGKGGPNGDAPKAYIWIENTNNPSNPPSAGDYEPAGIEVPLENGNGRGSAKISNVSVEVKKGRTARTGTNRPNGVSLTNGGAKVAAVIPQGNLAAGLNLMPPLTLAQTVTSDNGDTLLETWT